MSRKRKGEHCYDLSLSCFVQTKLGKHCLWEKNDVIGHRDRENAKDLLYEK